jgi:hypothetical protein
MEDQIGVIISILGFYLSLISILGSFFYIHLGNWLKQIQTTQRKWSQFKSGSNLDKKIECYIEAFDEKNLQPAFGFILLTIFMILLGLFALDLRSTLPSTNDLANYLYIPGYIFFALYCIVSLIYLVYGYYKVNKVYKEIEAGILN